MSNTRKCVSDIQTAQSCLKKTQLCLVFATYFSVFGYQMKHDSSCLIYYFSNSLIIHQEKTKKITTMTVVWICDPNYHKILLTLALNFPKNY